MNSAYSDFKNKEKILIRKLEFLPSFWLHNINFKQLLFKFMFRNFAYYFFIFSL